MQDKLKEIISKSENLAELFGEREGAAIFLKWVRIPRIIFFSRGHESQGARKFSRHLLSTELYCSVQYNSCTFFKEKILGTIFEDK